MPENPNIDPGTGSESFCETNVNMAANSNNNNKKQGVPRVPSAGHKYYDIATQLLGKAGSDLEELFIAAARDGVYDRIENFLQHNRTEYVVSIDVKDKKTGNTPLIWAAKRGHIKIVQLLLGHGADITLRNYEGQTAVEIASHSIRSLLLESVERTTEASHQLLLQAAWQGDIQVVSRLLNQKKVLDINCKNADGFTPIMLATRDMHFFERLSTQMSRAYNPVEVVSSLLSVRSDLHATDGDGKTCLHHAAQSKAQIAQTVVATIIAGCPDLEQKDKRCFAPLHCAALTGNADCITTLLDGGSEINSRGFAGATALHITSYNDHEKATLVLLEHGANVTLTDDRGLTPLNFAKTRKMKKKLQEAWTEATAATKSTTTLAPIRTHSREDLRASMEDLTKKKKKGEVIFEGLPSNPFRESSKKESITVPGELRRANSLRELGSFQIDKFQELCFPAQLDTFPRYHSKGVIRHHSLKEKSGHGEEDSSQPPVRDSVRKLGQVRNQQKPSPLPCKKSHSTERLPLISPDRSGSDRNFESPVPFRRNSHSRWSFEDKKNGKSSRAAALSREVTMTVNPYEDGLDQLTPGTASPTPSLYIRSESDPNWGTPNLLDIAASCEPYLHGQRKGRSNSISSDPINDFDINCQTPVQRETTVMSVQRETTLMSICSNRTDNRMATSTNSQWMLNLGQMLSKSKTPVQPLYGPHSSKVLPPTPTFMTQRCGSNLDGNSEVDHSPRSDYEMDFYKKLIENSKELPRSKTMYKDEFVLEESCPKTPVIHSSSHIDTLSSSSGSSHLTSSPRDSPLSMLGNLERRSGAGKVSKSNGKFSKTFAKKTTGNGIKGSNSNKINFARGDKTLSKVIGDLAKPSHANLTADGKNNVDLHLIGVNNSSVACDKAFKSNNVKKEGSKGGGIIHMNGNIDAIVEMTTESEQCVGDSKDGNENVSSKQLVANKSDRKGANFIDNTSTKMQSGAISNENQAKTNKRNKETSKHMHKVLHVIPSKLTENIIRTAPKGVKDTKPGIKNVSNKNVASSNANKAKEMDTVHNVNMQLSPAAQHVNRLANSSVIDSNHEKVISGENSNEIIKINENDVVLGDKKTEVNQANGNAATAIVPEKNVTVGQSKGTIGQANSLNQLDISKTSDKSNSLQSVNRQGAASKNKHFNASKSVAVNQMQTPNVRKTFSSYTPRFQGGIASKHAHANNFNNKPSEHTNSLNINLISGLNLSCHGDASQSESKTSKATKLIKSASATDLVTPSMCRTGSATKSYNMAAVHGLPKSSSCGSVTSDIAAASKSTTVSPTSNTSEPISVKNSVVSKSTTDALQGSAKVSSTSIVSKSVSQMPSVGTGSINMLNPKSHFRSSSMSTIEEVKEAKLMSSLDTKIPVTSNNELATKQRPASDGPAGACRDVTEPLRSGTVPLVEILPDGAPRIYRKNYVDMTNLVSTPIIVNPFEELEQKREKERLGSRTLTETDISFGIDKTSFERSKTQVSMKSRNLKSAKKNKTKDGKPSSASTRGSSGKRKRSKSKETNKSDTENSRPKSGKSNRRVRSGRRKRKVPENLVKQNEKSDIALISGIGWQIATSCIDKSEVDAVIVSQISSSESESDDDVDINKVPSVVHVEDPPEQSQLLVSNTLESLSSLHSPHFQEVHQVLSQKHTRIDGLPYVANDGYRPMNLDMTQHSSLQQNNRSGVIVDQDDFESLNSSRAGVIINQNIPDNITEFLFRIQKNEASYDDNECGDKDDSDENEENVNMKNEFHRGMPIGQLTPIPESPSITHTLSSLQRVAKTVEALNRFDQNVNNDDLNMLLGDNTPRDSNSFKDYSSEYGGSWSSKTSPLRGAGGSLKSSLLQKETKQSLSISGNIRSLTESTRNSHSKTSHSKSSYVTSAESKDKINKVTSSQALPNGNHRDSNLRVGSGSQQMKAAANERLDSLSENKLIQNFENDSVYNSAGKKIDPNSEIKERIDSKILDLKKLLAEKMQSTKKLLEENASYSLKRKQNESSSGSNVSSQDSGEVKLDFKDLVVEECKVIETSRTDDEVKSSRSSRRERKFSETKNIAGEHDEDMMEAIEDIMSNNFSSAKISLKLGHSLRSASSTLTEAADINVLQKMVEINQSAPFHAKLTTPTNKEATRVSSSFDESITLNKDNPNLMQRFHAENFNIGQKVKAMIEAGADTLKVKAMVKADEEAKQFAKIRNSFRQMELYAGPQSQNRSSKKESPRKDGDTMYTSLSKFDQVGMPPRPGSSGAGKIRGKFTEIKGKKSASHVGESSTNALQNPADNIIHCPHVRVSQQHDSDQVFDLDHGKTECTQDEQMDHILLTDDTLERAASSCSTVSSSSSVYEETIKWKKGNVLGKGAFGTVWCGLTSEGHLIAIKQIELNTNNKHKAKKEYEKVQEEVELLKTLEHKNIVGYLGTSLEDSIVSIFMQFVPGGSIASILARFGALDESVFRKYTKQILEGVEYLHSADVIHRDIKGGNVMLMPNGVIKLIDFGCAKRLCINLSMGQSQILKSMKGTPYWMAPEVVNETGHGKKSDIWSIGCTVFEMATRKPPWAEMNPMSAIFAIGSDKPVPQLPEKFSEEARAFVNACLTKDQTKRPSASELLQSSFIKRRSKKSSSNC